MATQTKQLSEKSATSIQSSDNLLAFRGGAVERVTQASFIPQKSMSTSKLVGNEFYNGQSTVGELKAKILEAYANDIDQVKMVSFRIGSTVFKNWDDDSFVNPLDLTYHLYNISPYSAQRYAWLAVSAPTTEMYIISYNSGIWLVRQLFPTFEGDATDITCPLIDYSGSTINDFITWLQNITESDNGDRLRQFQSSINLYWLDNFSNRNAATEGDTFRCTFTKIATYKGSNRMWKWMVTSGSVNVFYTIANSGTNNYSCCKFSGTSC